MVWEHLTEEKAQLILSEAKILFESTLDARSEIEKKTTYLLGYCFVWISGLMSFVFINHARLQFFIIPIIVYLFGLILIAHSLIKILYPTRYKLGGNFSRNMTTSQECIDQPYPMFVIGIAQELDDQSEDNIQTNNQKAASLKGGLQRLVYLSGLCLLLVLLPFLAQCLIG